MNKLLLPIISIFSLIIFGCGTMPEVQESGGGFTTPIFYPSLKEWINEEQPIPIGEAIFQAAVFLEHPDYPEFSNVYPYIISYTYMGFDDKNNVKVMYKYIHSHPEKLKKFIGFGDPPKEETLGLTLPLR